jgi:hypothetical protein
MEKITYLYIYERFCIGLPMERPPYLGGCVLDLGGKNCLVMKISMDLLHPGIHWWGYGVLDLLCLWSG